MEAERTGRALRLTGETDIDISVDIDGSGNYDLDSGSPFSTICCPWLPNTA